jgi:uncharacterized membrane protein YdbT with pleckstrin-like domain
MNLSKAVKNTLGNDESVKKSFSFGNRHIYVRLVLSLFKWLLIAAGTGIVIVILYQIGDAAAKGVVMPIFGADGQILGGAAGDFLQGFLMRSLVISALIFFLAFAPISIFYHLYYLRIANAFVLTDRRIIVKRGWLNTSIKSVNYDRITDVGVEQSFLDKILYNTGTLSISTAGGDGYELELNCISNPHEMKKNLYDLKEEYRRKAYPQQTATIAENDSQA